MKKLIIALLVVGAIALPALAANDLPSPFDKAKALAISKGVPIDSTGSMFLEIPVPGDELVRVVYISNGAVGIIHIRSNGDAIGVVYDENAECHLITKTGGVGPIRSSITKEQAQERAFAIFRILVTNKLI